MYVCPIVVLCCVLLAPSQNFPNLPLCSPMAMAGKTMRAVRYDSYGGGAAALKVIRFLFTLPLTRYLLLLLLLLF